MGFVSNDIKSAKITFDCKNIKAKYIMYFYRRKTVKEYLMIACSCVFLFWTNR